MKVGIFGGSFNPIHNGHIALAKAFLAQSGLDEVWFMVSPQNPFKKDDALLDENLRLAMVQKVLARHNKLVACNYEFGLPRPSYTWNTLQHLAQNFPHHCFTLLIGADNWVSFHKWFHAEDILASYEIMVYPRPGKPIDPTLLPQNVKLLDTPLLDISSTQIRNRVQRGEDISSFVPAEIREDVIKHYNF